MSENTTCPEGPSRSSAPNAIRPSPVPTSSTVSPGRSWARSRTVSRTGYKNSRRSFSRQAGSPPNRTSSSHRCHRSGLSAMPGILPAAAGERLRGALPAGLGQQLRDRGADLALACAEPGQHLSSGVAVIVEQREQEVLGADVVVPVRDRFVDHRVPDPQGLRGFWRNPGRVMRFLAGDLPDLPDLLAYRLRPDPEALQGPDREAVARTDQAQQDVLGAPRPAQPRGLLPGEDEGLLGVTGDGHGPGDRCDDLPRQVVPADADDERAGACPSAVAPPDGACDLRHRGSR